VFRFWETNPPARRRESEIIIRRVYALCVASGMDFSLAVSRIADETGSLNGPSFFVSDIYRERLNIGGLGVTDGGDEMLTFTDPIEAADAYMAHLFTYVLGDRFDVLDVTKDDDPRFAVTPRAWRGSVKTLQDLQGKWFTNPQGAINSANRGNAIFRGIPDQTTHPPDEGGNVADLNMTKGLIPLPFEERHIIDVSKRCQGDGRGFDWLGDRHIDALYVHRSQGTYTSNINHFDSHCPGALTDIQIDHVTGKAMRFVDLAAPRASKSAPSGWANGTVTDSAGNLIAIGDALKLIQKHGGNRNAVNRYAESCEVTGFFGPNGDDPVSPAAKRTIAQWMASRAHDYGIPWFDFPMITTEDRSFIIGHRESRGGNADDCPGDLIWSLIATEDAELIVMTRAIMKAAQTKGIDVPDPEPPQVVYPKKRVPGPDKVSHLGHPLKVNVKNRFLARQGGRFKTAPSADAPDGTATPYKAGKSYRFDYQTVNGKWLFAKSGSWAEAKNFEQLA
jgi:hypothetical protein